MTCCGKQLYDRPLKSMLKMCNDNRHVVGVVAIVLLLTLTQFSTWIAHDVDVSHSNHPSRVLIAPLENDNNDDFRLLGETSRNVQNEYKTVAAAVIQDDDKRAQNEPFRIVTNRTGEVEEEHHRQHDDSRSTSSSTGTTTTVAQVNDMTWYLARGPNFMFSISGCHFATWFAGADIGPRKFDDCYEQTRHESHRSLTQYNAHLVQSNDTIYVPTRIIKHFVEQVLPNITAPFVLLSGQDEYVRGHNLLRNGYQKALNRNPLVQWLFLQNPGFHTRKNRTILNPKVQSFPFGLQYRKFNKAEPGADPNNAFRDAFFRCWKTKRNLLTHDRTRKTRGIFYGYINRYTNQDVRANVTSGPKVPRHVYYDELARSRFVISPPGDRPDCYRNYEAIAFGAIPITNLDPTLYSYLEEGPVVYGNEGINWNNLTEDDAYEMLGRPLSSRTIVVNRNMVFEEYWIAYVEKVVGHELRWWDRVAKRPALLKDFVVDGNITLAGQ